MHSDPTQASTDSAPPSAALARRPQPFSAASGWIVAAGACLAVAVLCHTVGHYRAVLHTTMARLQLMPASVADGAEQPEGFVQMAKEQEPSADRL